MLLTSRSSIVCSQLSSLWSLLLASWVKYPARGSHSSPRQSSVSSSCRPTGDQPSEDGWRRSGWSAFFYQETVLGPVTRDSLACAPTADQACLPTYHTAIQSTSRLKDPIENAKYAGVLFSPDYRVQVCLRVMAIHMCFVLDRFSKRSDAQGSS